MAFKSWWKLLTQSENRNSSIRRKKHFAAAVRLEVLEDRFAPATLEWQGGAGNFSDSSKWLNTATLTNAVPADNDTLLFAGTGGAATATNDLAAGLSFVLNFTSSGNSISGNSINLDVAGTDISDTVGGNTITAGLTYVSGTTVSVGAGTLTVGNSDGTGGTVAGTGAGQSLTKLGTGTLVINSVMSGTGATLNANAGTFAILNVANTFDSASTLNVPTGGTASISAAPGKSIGSSAMVLSGGTVNMVTGVGGVPNVVGLKEAALAGGDNETDPIPANGYFIEYSPRAGENSDGTGSWVPDANPFSLSPDPTWSGVDNVTYAYEGQFFLSDGSNGVLGDGLGTIAFAENIDDNAWIRVDGVVIMNDAAWNVPTRAQLTNIPVGWHNIEIRLGEFGGGAGAVGGDGWTPSFGFGFNSPFEADGVTAVPSWSATGANGANFRPFYDRTSLTQNLPVRLTPEPVTIANAISVTANSTINLDASLPSVTTNTSTLNVSNGVSLAVNGSSKTLRFTGATTLGAAATFNGTGATLSLEGAVNTPASVTINQTGSGTTAITGLVSATNATISATAGNLKVTNIGNAFNASSTVSSSTGGTVTIAAAPATSIGSASVNVTGGSLAFTTGTGAFTFINGEMDEGWVDGGFNTTTANPKNWTTNRTDAGYNSDTGTGGIWGPGTLPNPRVPASTNLLDRRWHADNYLQNGAAANETWVYTGQFFVPDTDDASDFNPDDAPGDGKGTVQFAEQLDDNVLVRVDGVTRLSNTSWNNASGTGMLTLPTGWHDFDIRFGNGGGGAGAVAQGVGWSPTKGFGFATIDTPGFAPWPAGQDNSIDGNTFIPFQAGQDIGGGNVLQIRRLAAPTPINNPISISGNSNVIVDNTITATTGVNGALSIAGGSKVTFTQADTNGRVRFNGVTTLGGNVEFFMTNTTGLARPQFAGSIVGAGANVLKSGPGNITLLGTNTFSGTTTVTGGTMFLSAAGALSGTSSVTVSSGGTVQFATSGINIAVPVSISGGGNGGVGAIQNASGTNTISSNITLADDASIGSDSGLLTISGNINMGTSSLTYVGAGNTTVTGNVTGSGSGFYTYAGFTGATGGLNVTQTIVNWTYDSATTDASLSSNLSILGSAVQSAPGQPLVLTPSINDRTGGAWVKVDAGLDFTSTFQFQFSGGNTANPADAFVFALQSNSLTTLGGGGGGAGLAGVPNSLGVGFNIYNGNTLGNGNDLITFLNGTRTNQVDLFGASGGLIDFRNVDPSNVFEASLIYDVDTLTASLSLKNVTTNTNFGVIGSLPNVVIPRARYNSIVKNGTGTVTMSGANNYAGDTTVNNGVLAAGSATALDNTNSVTVNNGGTLALTNGITFAKPITANGNGYNNAGAIGNVSGTNTLSGPVTSANGFSFGGTGGTLNVTGNTTSSGTVGFSGSAAVNVTGNITVSPVGMVNMVGQYFVGPASQAQLIPGDPAYLGDPANLANAFQTPLLGTINFPGIGDGTGNVSYLSPDLQTNINTGYYNNQARWVGKINIPNNGISGNPISFQTGSDDGSVLLIDGVLVVDNNFFQGTTYRQATVNLTPGLHDIEVMFMEGGGGASMFALWDPNGGANFSFIPNVGTAGITKTGTGVATLSGTNTYTGPTTISGGTLVVTNTASLGTTSGITVNSGGTLGLANNISLAVPVTANGSGASGQAGAITNVSGNNSITSTIKALDANKGTVSIGSTAGTLTTAGIDLRYSQVVFGGAGSVVVNGAISSTATTAGVAGFNEKIFNGVPFDAQVDIQGYQSATPGADGGVGILSAAPVGYNDNVLPGTNNSNISVRAAQLGAVGFDAGDWSAVWTTNINVPLTEAESVWNFRVDNNVDDNIAFFLDQNGDGQLTNDERFYNRGCCGNTGDVFTPINLVPGQTYKFGITLSDTGGGGFIVSAQFQSPTMQNTGVWAPLGNTVGYPNLFRADALTKNNSVVKTGTGTTTLNIANTYTGTTTVNGGVLSLTNSGAVASTSGIVVNSGGTFQLDGTGLAIAKPITVSGSGSSGQGAINNNSGNNTLSGPITLNGNGSIGSAAGTLSVNGNVTAAASLFSPIASANLTFTGAGNITVNGQIQSSPVVTAPNELAGNAYNNISPSNGGVPLTPTAAGWLGNYTGSNITSSAPLTVPIDFPNIDTAPGYTGWVNDANLAFNTGALWYGLVTIPAGAPATQTWFTGSDDGSRLWIDGNLVVDNNFDQGVTFRSGTTTLAPGSTHAILIGFYQGGGGAGMFADWDVGAGQVRIPIDAFTRVVSGGGVNAVIKEGTGTVSLAAAAGNTYSGGTTINAGTLRANNTSNSATGSGAVTVAGGNLGGTGTVTGPVTVNTGSVAPGNSAGTLKVTGAVNFTATSTFNVELDSPAAADKLEATGAVTLGNAQLSVTALPAAVLSGTVYTIVSGSSVSGTFNGLANGASFTQGGVSYTINYTATTVTLTVNAPTITGLSPFSGPTAGGNTVIITGTGFGAGVTGAAAVKFGVVNATSYVVISASEIQAVAPAQPAGTVDVSVTNNGQTSANTAADNYTYGSASPAPNFGTFTLNGGDMYAINAYGVQVAGLSGSNSIIEQLYVTFDIGVTVGSGAFTIDAGPVAVSIPGGVNPVPAGTNVVTVIAEPDATTLDTNGGFKGYRLRFSGSSTYLNSFDNSPTGNGGAGNIFTTLKDGYYKLNINGANVHAGNSLAGTPMASNVVQNFWTMYASVDPSDRSISATPGDGNSVISVNASVIGFAATNGFGYGTDLSNYNVQYDWNLDGDVGDDLIEFAKRFGAEWSF